MNRGLLLVTMEPPPAMTEEFHDWYDTEHVPERLALPGFRGATRWVCVQGWPRFLALYDLDSPATLDTPEYRAVSGDRFSPWSKRILPRTIGRVRVVAEQVVPGDAVLPPQDQVACLVAARFPAVPDTGPIIGSPGLLQVRSFRCVDGSPHGWVLAAFDRVVGAAAIEEALGRLGPSSQVNLYRPYVRAS